VEASPRGGKSVQQYIEETVKGNPIVLFMKGSPLAPQCGFSAGSAGILHGYGKTFAHVDVLADPEVREGVKQYTSWPTIPQVFIGGEFVGGADILRQLHDSGELRALIEKAG
jgi:monothiol glutaredoxin